MSEKTKRIDFVAALRYRTTEEGGRKTPVFNSGYRPQIKFEFSEMQTSGEQRFLNKETVYPGDTVDAEIEVLSSNIFENNLSEGMTFEFREGSKIIGAGTIKQIINVRLKKASR